MSRGPVVYDDVVSGRVLKSQKEMIRCAAIQIGMNLGTFVRTTLLKEAARINKEA